MTSSPAPEEAIRECPFCGAQPFLHEIPPHTHIFATFMPDHPGSWAIECSQCDAAFLRETRSAAIAAWNRRAGGEREQQLEAALEQANAALICTGVWKDFPNIMQHIHAALAGQTEAQDWHERADKTKCHAASQRSDGECWWRYCPAKDGVCPLPQEECPDE